ncbi:NERD domain-containing protein [Sporosarcina sp. PTS2304]|uniref:nuclease-related domain-containing protein n=1 Tax=Sporosarcina sp. PTS2304 TaxID=2283194 RepID=UPI000E0D76E3|nr:nuclease-related domain-containing protein [Sporosarcina sp. PTS2304]AXH99790.1 NERD domain-containing protein [Sporosarcina sp. PTS2304]
MELFFDTLRIILTDKAYWFLAIMIALSAIVKLQLPKIRGASGERIVRRRLNKLGDEYRSYHDLYIHDQQFGLTQVDHIVVSKFGVHVIETKNYTGWIFGSEHQKYWTQTIYKNKQKFYNPIRQNYGHVEALKSHLNMIALPAYSIIAFSSKAEFKFKEPFHSAEVIHYRKLVKTIKQDDRQRLTDHERKRIISSLDELDQLPKKKKKAIRKMHLRQVREKQQAARI